MVKNNYDLTLLNLKGYHPPIIKNRMDNSGYSGHLTWISKDLFNQRVITFEKAHMEILWTEVIYNKNKILLGNIYRPPNSSAQWWDNFQIIFNENIESNNYKKKLINDPHLE